jgi:hypothetical protein
MSDSENKALRQLARDHLREIMLGTAKINDDPAKYTATIDILKHVSPEEDAAASEGDVLSPFERVLNALEKEVDDGDIIDLELVRKSKRN